MQYQRKVSTVEARQHDLDTSINIHSVKKGAQTARKGDFLVTDESVEAGSVGSVYVVSKADFLAEYEEVVPEIKEEQK